MPAPIFPTQHTWTALEDVTAASLNSNVRDGTNFHNGGPNGKPLVSIRQSVAQSIPNDTHPLVPVQMDATDLDNAGGHSTTDNSRYVCQLGGWYQINIELAMTPSTTGVVYVNLNLNGAAVQGSAFQAIALGANYNTLVRTSKLLHMNAGDYLQVMAYQNSGAPVNTATNDQSSLDGVWISL